MLSLLIHSHSTEEKSQGPPIPPSSEYHDDDDASLFATKFMFFFSILITIGGQLFLLFIYKYVRLYQGVRNDNLEEQLCFDQIDYLIHLITRQEKVLLEMGRMQSEKDDETAKRGGTAESVVANKEIVRRYNQMSKKFYNELDILHEMMSNNKLELKMQRKGVMR